MHQQEKIGDYRLEHLLGKGGMGEVWKSTHKGLNIPVAIKTLLLKDVDEDMRDLTVKRFISEAEMTGSLNHSNIIRIYEVGQDGDRPFIAMEYVEGDDLLVQMKKNGGCLEEGNVIDISLVISGALEVALHNGIIHRDIKPDNILLDRHGNLKLADLGIAKRLNGGESLTMTGCAVGTPNYISPEQAVGDVAVDHRSDIYSLGATMYHLVTGTLPYSGTTPVVIMMKHVQDPLPHPSTLRNDLSDGFCAVICKMMEKNPVNRYQSYADLVHDLNEVKAGAPLEKLIASKVYESLIEPQSKTVTVNLKPTKNKMLVVLVSLALLLSLFLIVSGMKKPPAIVDEPSASGGEATLAKTRTKPKAIPKPKVEYVRPRGTIKKEPVRKAAAGDLVRDKTSSKPVIDDLVVISPESSNAVTGLNLTKIVCNKAIFENVSGKMWLEKDFKGKKKFSFMEEERTINRVTLYDAGRRMRLNFDLILNRLTFEMPNQAARPLYKIEKIYSKDMEAVLGEGSVSNQTKTK